MANGWRSTVDVLLADLRRVFGPRLQSLVVYGSHADGSAANHGPVHTLTLVESLLAADLEALARQSHVWRRHGLATPLVLPADEFRRSLDAFPLEYGEIIRAHALILGSDPFDGAVISREDLRRACETQVKSHLVHLRETFIEASGNPAAIAELVTASAPAFAALLRTVARLRETPRTDSALDDAPDAANHGRKTQLTLEGARSAGLPDGIVASILALEQPSSIAVADAARLFPEYLAAVERLAQAVDAWRP